MDDSTHMSFSTGRFYIIDLYSTMVLLRNLSQTYNNAHSSHPIKRATVSSTSTVAMKLSLLLLLLIPLYVQSRHRREDTKEQRERPEEQHVRRVQQMEVPIVSCAGGAFREWYIPLHTLL
jgi:hypothetical protein